MIDSLFQLINFIVTTSWCFLFMRELKMIKELRKIIDEELKDGEENES